MPKKTYECMFTDIDDVARFGIYCQMGDERDEAVDFIICGCCGGIIDGLPIETKKIDIGESWEPIGWPRHIW